MSMRHALVLLVLFGSAAAAATDFTIQDVTDARKTDVTQIKPGTIAFSDHTGTNAVNSETALFHFDDWADKHPTEKKFLALYPSYTEPTDPKIVNGTTSQVLEKLYMYVAQARFVVDRPPGAIDLSRYVNLPFLQKIDPAITHKALAPSDIGPFNDEAGTGNVNPDRTWCTGRTTLICIQSSYKLEGKIPMGIMLVNKIRDGSKKVPDHIDFQSELSALGPDDIDQAGLQELTMLNTPVSRRARAESFLRQPDPQIRRNSSAFSRPIRMTPTRPSSPPSWRSPIKASVLDRKTRLREHAGPAQSRAGASADGAIIVQFRQFDLCRPAGLCPQRDQDHRRHFAAGREIGEAAGAFASKTSPWHRLNLRLDEAAQDMLAGADTAFKGASPCLPRMPHRNRRRDRRLRLGISGSTAAAPLPT